MAGTEKGGRANRGIIFASVGTHPQQFDRLLAEIDSLCAGGKITGEVFAQTGYSAYIPQHFRHKKFLSLEKFAGQASRARIFITHAGEGNIGLGKNLGRKMVVVPRRREFGEHTNDHQLELAQVVEEKGMGLVAWQPGQIAEKLADIEKFRPAKIPRGNIVQILEAFGKKKLGW